MAVNRDNEPIVKVRLRAHDPQGNYKETVTLTSASRKRYERMGWTFTRPGLARETGEFH